MIAPSRRTMISESAARKIRLRVAAVAAGCDQARSRSAPSGGGRRAIRAALPSVKAGWSCGNDRYRQAETRGSRGSVARDSSPRAIERDPPGVRPEGAARIVFSKRQGLRRGAFPGLLPTAPFS